MAGTELFPDTPFDPNSPWNILITLTLSDTNLSNNTITMSKELLEAKLFPFLCRAHLVGLLQKNEPAIMDFFDYDAKIATTLTIRKEGNGNFNFHGWSMILQRKHFKAGNTIAFWWDNAHSRPNFQLLA